MQDIIKARPSTGPEPDLKFATGNSKHKKAQGVRASINEDDDADLKEPDNRRNTGNRYNEGQGGSDDEEVVAMGTTKSSGG